MYIRSLNKHGIENESKPSCSVSVTPTPLRLLSPTEWVPALTLVLYSYVFLSKMSSCFKKYVRMVLIP